VTTLPFPHQPAPSRGPDKRRTPRFSGSVPALLVTLAGRVETEIVDASLTGVRLRFRTDALIPRQSRLLVPSMDLDILVQRRWQKGKASGWRFVYGTEHVDGVEQAITALAARLG
jgi:hypothetical protein